MPTPQANVRLSDDLIAAARRKLDLPDDAPAAQVVRAAFMRFLGNTDHDGQPEGSTIRGGRAKGSGVKRESAEKIPA